MKKPMAQPQQTLGRMSQPDRFSYAFMAVVLIAVAALHLATPLLTALFGYLALTRLHVFIRRKWLLVLFFSLLVIAAGYVLTYFLAHAFKALPEIADRSIPSIIAWAKAHQIELPFTDYDTLKDTALDTAKGQVQYLAGAAKLARGAAKQVIFVIAGLFVAASLFLHPGFELRAAPGRLDLYHLCCEAIARRFAILFQSFATVMGAQIIISAINTALTGIFALSVSLPYGLVIVGVTFLCGLIPVIGNLISNTVIVGVGFTVSPHMALWALIFLVLVHKLEYLLNSKIVGHRIRNPLWLTLLALIVGEKLIGFPGLILAPIILNYIRLEASEIK